MYLGLRTDGKGGAQPTVGISGPLAKDFTPWWDEFSSKDSPKKSLKTPTRAKTGNTENPDGYDSWFSNTSSQGDNWLAGPQKVAKSQKSQVEDIPVPSIYEQSLTSKGRRSLKRERKAEREKTLGKKWFDMKAPDKDDPARVDMELIQMRGVLDPKRFYKHQDRKAVPKYFQMGTVVDEGTDFYASRLTKKQRKQTLVEELMADANIRQYNKKKYAELQQKMRGKKKFKGKSQ